MNFKDSKLSLANIWILEFLINLFSKIYKITTFINESLSILISNLISHKIHTHFLIRNRNFMIRNRSFRIRNRNSLYAHLSGICFQVLHNMTLLSNQKIKIMVFFKKGKLPKWLNKNCIHNPDLTDFKVLWKLIVCKKVDRTGHETLFIKTFIFNWI